MAMEFRILGPLEVLRSGRRVRLGTPKMRHLMAVLVLDAGRVVSIDRLVEEMWRNESTPQSRHALQSYVSRLRTALGGDVLVTRSPGYVLDVDPDSCDAARFERLAASGRGLIGHGRPREAEGMLGEALALWRGPALDGIEGVAVEAAAAHLHELRLSAVEDRFEAGMDSGLKAEIAPELEALTSEHPLRERLWALRIRALYLAGRQADALAAYAEMRQLLVSELGIDPSAELRALEEAILRQDESLARRAVPAPADSALDGHLEIWGPGGRTTVALGAPRVTIGRAPDNTIVLDSDSKVSAKHAVLERGEGSWHVRDLGSRNGTWLNGERFADERDVAPGDEIRVGSTLLKYRRQGSRREPAPPTVGAVPPPELTPHERRILAELCRPAFSSAALAEPATDGEIAAATGEPESYVSEILEALYGKFSVRAGERTELANRAVDAGVVSPRDLV